MVTPPELQTKLKQKLKIPDLFLDRMCLQSNGFSGYEVSLDQDQGVETYSGLRHLSNETLLVMAYMCLAFWSRFTVKQTYDTLKPKRTFTPHVSNHQSGTDTWDAEIIVHGPQSTRYGWEWYEMGFVACWNSSGPVTLVCFHVPERMQSNVQSLFGVNAVDTSAPYAVFSLISDALLRLYDDSVWSIRNHISQWEAVGRSFHIFDEKYNTHLRQRRSQETDYFRLHEIARHGVHVSETLRVAIRTLNAIWENHERFHASSDLASDKSRHTRWDKIGSRFEFQYGFLQGLLDRSEANNARIQNEIALVRLL